MLVCNRYLFAVFYMDCITVGFFITWSFSLISLLLLYYVFLYLLYLFFFSFPLLIIFIEFITLCFLCWQYGEGCFIRAWTAAPLKMMEMFSSNSVSTIQNRCHDSTKGYTQGQYLWVLPVPSSWCLLHEISIS